MPGVAAVATADDVPGVNDVGPAFPGDPIFADGLVEYCGQSLFAVAADSIAHARHAAASAVIEYDVLPPVLTVDAALEQQAFVLPSQVMARGDSAAALARSPLRLAGRLDVGGQEHFYLEGQVAMAIPGEDGDMHVLSSTQHPTEVQHLVARALKLADHAVVCENRRMGGAFGGKESQASLIACVAALLAQRTKRPVKLRLDRPLRIFSGPVRCDQRPCDVPRRQLLLPRQRPHRVAPLQDAHRVQHRVSRLWWPAGHDGHRIRHRRDRAPSFARSAARAPTQFLRQE
jgi:xanthine dehydrogenase large subunit